MYLAILFIPPFLTRDLGRPQLTSLQCRSLIHAMLAVTSNHISTSSLSSRAYFPIGTPMSSPHHPEHDFPSSSSTRFSASCNPGSGGPPRTLGYSIGSSRSTLTSPLARFQLWHRRKAFEAAPEYFDKGDKLVQVVQAHVIATMVDQYNAWWVDLWMESGTCMRMAVPLCLNETTSEFGRESV